MLPFASLSLSRGPTHTHTNTHTHTHAHTRTNTHTLPYHFSFPFDRHPRLLTLRRYSHVMFEMKMNVFRIAINTAAIRLRRARFSPTFAPLSSSRFLNASRRAASNVCNAHRRVFACKSYPLSDLSFHNYPFRSFLSFFLFFLFLFFFFFCSSQDRKTRGCIF